MKRWLRKFEIEFPDELKETDYTQEDLKNWIETLETGITKNGSNFLFEKKKRVSFKYKYILKNARIKFT